MGQTDFESRETIQGWNRNFLEDYLETLAEKKNWEFFNTTLALLLYGLIIFPFTIGMIDHTTMDVFFAYETRGENPILAILANTFLSMEICHQKKREMLRCCDYLLFVWLVTHLYASNHMGYFLNPLRSFHHILLKKQEAMEWNKDLSKLEVEHFQWV